MTARKVICRGKAKCAVPGCSCAAGTPKAPAYAPICACCKPRFDDFEIEHLVWNAEGWSSEYHAFIRRVAKQCPGRLPNTMDAIQAELLRLAAKLPEPEDA